MYIVISYDIRDDKRRNKIHKTLKNYGTWVQFSIFECSITEQNYLILKNKLNKLIDKDEDSVRFYFLCAECQHKVERIGGVMPLDEELLML